MNLWGFLLKCVGWSVDIHVPYRNKCIICVAPHTSNWDFPIGLFAYRSIGRKANFLMKGFWFFFPMKYLMRALGGIPVYRKKFHTSLTDYIISRFKTSSHLNLAVTPEGTRKAIKNWRTGFLYIAYGANIPIQIGIIDYKTKQVIIRDEYFPSGDVEIDMSKIKSYYAGLSDAALYPTKFSL